MKRLALLFAGGAVWLFLAAVPVFADGGPHVRGAGVIADSCAGCHRTHTATQQRLLLAVQPALCYTCHGTTGTGAANDVQNGVAYTLTTGVRTATVAGALRGGGFVNARINSAAPTGQTATGSASAGIVPVLAAGLASTSSHSVDGTSVTAWGIGALNSGAGTQIQLACGSCHDPHGNGNYRTLRPIPSQSGAAAVTIADETTKVYTTTNYWAVAAGAIAITTPPGVTFIASANAWCATCHTRYSASSGSGSTSSGDTIFNYRHRTDLAGVGEANCVQCHVAHGSNAAQGLTSQTVKNPDGTAAVPVTDSRLLRIDNRGTCQMCHSK